MLCLTVITVTSTTYSVSLVSTYHELLTNNPFGSLKIFETKINQWICKQISVVSWTFSLVWIPQKPREKKPLQYFSEQKVVYERLRAAARSRSADDLSYVCIFMHTYVCVFSSGFHVHPFGTDTKFLYLLLSWMFYIIQGNFTTFG